MKPMSKNKLDYKIDIYPVRILLNERWPRVFAAPKSKQPKHPLKIGIYTDLLKAFSEIDPVVLKAALGDYTSGPKYVEAMKPGAKRIGLDGKFDGIVVDSDVAHHKHRFYQQNKRYEERRREKFLKEHDTKLETGV